MNKWKILYFGLGFVAGLGAASFFGSRKGIVRSAASTVLSYGLNAKRKIEAFALKGKENISDLVAESEDKANVRRSGDAVIVRPEGK
jgi:hypothetical protein